MPAHSRPPLSLAVRRASLLVRIHAARRETADVGRLIAVDLEGLARSQRAIHAGWKVFKASLVAAGVIWSFNATSRIGRGRRLFTLAVSLLSTMRAMRRISSFLGPLLQTTHRQA
jgi:hypothetical protein